MGTSTFTTVETGLAWAPSFTLVSDGTLLGNLHIPAATVDFSTFSETLLVLKEKITALGYGDITIDASNDPFIIRAVKKEGK